MPVSENGNYFNEIVMLLTKPTPIHILSFGYSRLNAFDRSQQYGS